MKFKYAIDGISVCFEWYFLSANQKRGFVFTAAMVVLIGCIAIPLVEAKPDLNDKSITDAVEDELFMDKAVPSHRISVATTDGIVTLTGSTDNILAKERAARIAEIVKGVRAVVNRIEVDPTILRTDREIRADVLNALLTDPATDSYEVDVTVAKNAVTLSGTVTMGVYSHKCGRSIIQPFRKDLKKKRHSLQKEQMLLMQQYEKILKSISLGVILLGSGLLIWRIAG